MLAAQAIWLPAPAWAGTGTWAIQVMPNPAGAGQAAPAAVSCDGGAGCTAVGRWELRFRTLAERN